MGGDSNTWYKKYSNGFIEQGGIASSISTGNTITFNTAFVNSPFVMAYRPDGASYPDIALKLSSVPYSITNSKFNISVGGNGNKIIWYACGY